MSKNFSLRRIFAQTYYTIKKMLKMGFTIDVCSGAPPDVVTALVATYKCYIVNYAFSIMSVFSVVLYYARTKESLKRHVCLFLHFAKI